MFTTHGLQHIGLTVPNMQEAVDFLTNVFGAVTVMERGAVDVDDEFMLKHLGVPDGCKIADQRVLQVGTGGALELFEYSGIEGQQTLKHNGEVGAMHVAFEVDDAFAAAERMHEAGVDLLEGPTLIESGPMDGLGGEVNGIEIGDLRFCMGLHRSTQQLPPEHTLPVPPSMEAKTAVIARLMGVSMSTLMTTSAHPGDKVIVCGAGPVGICAAHNFNIAAYDVSVVEPDEKRREQITSTGIESTFASMPLDNPTYAKKVKLVVDCSGNEAAVLDACNIVAQRGEVVLVGVPWKQQTQIAAHELMQSVFFNYVKLRSGWEFELPIHARDFVWEELLEGYNSANHSIFSGFTTALDWLAAGKLDVSPLTELVKSDNPAQLYTSIRNREIESPFIVPDWGG